MPRSVAVASWTSPDAPDAPDRTPLRLTTHLRFERVRQSHTKHTSIECRTHLRGELLTQDRESILLISKSKLITQRRCEDRLPFLGRQISTTDSLVACRLCVSPVPLMLCPRDMSSLIVWASISGTGLKFTYDPVLIRYH